MRRRRTPKCRSILDVSVGGLAEGGLATERLLPAGKVCYSWGSVSFGDGGTASDSVKKELRAAAVDLARVFHTPEADVEPLVDSVAKIDVVYGARIIPAVSSFLESIAGRRTVEAIGGHSKGITVQIMSRSLEGKLAVCQCLFQEKSNVVSEAEKVKGWLEEKETLQKSTPAHSPPAFTSEEVVNKILDLQDKVASINRIPKPKPKIENKPAKEEEPANKEKIASSESASNESQEFKSVEGDQSASPETGDSEPESHDEL